MATDHQPFGSPGSEDTIMPEPRPLNDDEREDLTAYLDGELEGEAAREVAAKISLDPQVREEAEALDRAWDMLDYLPRPEPSPSFTHRTLERISTYRPAPQPAGRRRRAWLVGVAWAAAVLLAAAAGFAGVTFLMPPDRTDQELVHDLRIIENKRLYDPIDDMDFLLELSHPDLFGDEASGG